MKGPEGELRLQSPSIQMGLGKSLLECLVRGWRCGGGTPGCKMECRSAPGSIRCGSGMWISAFLFLGWVWPLELGKCT